MDAMQILVVILSAFLAAFLILGIVLAIMLIQVTRQIRQISEKAGNAVTKASMFAENVAKFTTPSIMADTIKNTVSRLREDKKGK